MKYRPHAVILNSHSHAGSGLNLWKKFCRSDRARKYQFEQTPCFSGGKDALRPWITELYKSGARNWVVVGGDGTVHLALNCFVDLGIASEITVGAVGVGSSNDFHKPRSGNAIPCRLDFSQARKYDLGRVYLDDSDIPIHFAINSSIGVTAEANLKFNLARGGLRVLKKHWTDGAILATALKTFSSYRNLPLRLQYDGSERPVQVTNLGVIKNRYFSGSFRYDEGPAVPGVADGNLGFFLCHDMGKGRMLKTLFALSQGKFCGLPLTECRRIQRLDVSSEGRQIFCVETDGEVALARKARFDVSREAISLCP